MLGFDVHSAGTCTGWCGQLFVSGCRTEARSAFQACRNLQAAAKLSDQRNGTSYNLWLADGLMLLAVRSQEACGPVAVNTLGFAGTILVKSDDQMQYLREHGPLHVLQHVGTAWGRPI